MVPRKESPTSFPTRVAFELKVNKPPKVAMSQVQRKKYAAPYRAAGKPVWVVGLSFNGRTRQFKGGTVESVKVRV